MGTQRQMYRSPNKLDGINSLSLLVWQINRVEFQHQTSNKSSYCGCALVNTSLLEFFLYISIHTQRWSKGKTKRLVGWIWPVAAYENPCSRIRVIHIWKLCFCKCRYYLMWVFKMSFTFSTSLDMANISLSVRTTCDVAEGRRYTWRGSQLSMLLSNTCKIYH